MTKPAKEGDPGFDPTKLIIDTDAPADEQYEDEPGDERDDDDALSLDELTEQFNRTLTEAMADDDEDEPTGDAPADDDIKGRLARAEAALAARDKRDARQRELEERKAAGKEILAVVHKLKLTKPQLERTVKFFEKNPDLEGVVPFEDAAKRVNGLGDRVSSPATNGRNGSPSREENAQVITRGGGGPAPKRESFKPVADRGNYSNVTAAIMQRSDLLRKLIVPD